MEKENKVSSKMRKKLSVTKSAIKSGTKSGQKLCFTFDKSVLVYLVSLGSL